MKVTGKKLDLGSFGLLHPLLDLPLLKEVLPLPTSSSWPSTEQCRAFCHTQHPSIRNQHGILAEGVGFRILRYRHPFPMQHCYWKLLFLIFFSNKQCFTCYYIAHNSELQEDEGWCACQGLVALPAKALLRNTYTSIWLNNQKMGILEEIFRILSTTPQMLFPKADIDIIILNGMNLTSVCKSVQDKNWWYR